MSSLLALILFMAAPGIVGAAIVVATIKTDKEVNVPARIIPAVVLMGASFVMLIAVLESRGKLPGVETYEAPSAMPSVQPRVVGSASSIQSDEDASKKAVEEHNNQLKDFKSFLNEN